MSDEVLASVWRYRNTDGAVASRHVRVGRWTVSWERTQPRGWLVSRGGGATPGPWWNVMIPRVGSLVVGYDRTLFGWDDPANRPEEAA